jgi:threonylcarbamoyladenosine tRNA methylthiotransferase MtaB
MPSAAFTTLGCKVNQYETQRILQSFESGGFRIVPFNEFADVYVINTCSVTSQAESKSRQTVRRAARQNGSAKIIVTGCASQMSLNKGESVEAADLVVPNPSKLDTFQYFAAAFPELANEAAELPAQALRPAGRTRATVKIQDGCSVYCSYCSIPYTRPVMSSRPYSEILDEVSTLAQQSYKEIILTGVLIGSYGAETGSGGPDFEDLIVLLAKVDGIERIRISSIEMTQVSSRLLSLMKDPGAKVVPHLHIPLQSGSTKVLNDMNRPYTQADYLALCRNLYQEVPDVGISTDIMVGFPTESDAEFSETVRVCEEVGYNKAHLFRFSPRYGTPADAFGDKISPQTKQERSAHLQQVTSESRMAFFQRFVGHDMEVLVESSNGLLRGHTGNYIEVEFAGPQTLVGSVCSVRLLSADSKTALGELCRSSSNA